ncbi:hypothetical protein A9G41_10715 [Gilliamella sp. Nev5-1]|nr:hypothetical protein A9G40_11820 [Gilliamella apicola]OCG67349.1 hypothetical protein A9G41_10715 [Gilliamella apicola]
MTENQHRYSLRALCRCLQVSRNSFYYQLQLTSKKTDKELSKKVKAVSNDNYQSYGTRRLQVALRKKSILLSRRRIARIMQENGLVSKYTCKKYRANTEQSNESTVSNELNREFTVGQQRK